MKDCTAQPSLLGADRQPENSLRLTPPDQPPTRRLARSRIHSPPLARPQRTASLCLPRLNSVSCNQTRVAGWRKHCPTTRHLFPLSLYSHHHPSKARGFLNSLKHHAGLEATREGIFSPSLFTETQNWSKADSTSIGTSKGIDPVSTHYLQSFPCGRTSTTLKYLF